MSTNSTPNKSLQDEKLDDSQLLRQPGKKPFGLNRRDVFSLLVWLGIVAIVAIAGGMVTQPGLDEWYESLNKPAFHPPNWIFGPVWTALYVMMAVAAWMVWRRRDEASQRRAVHFFAAIFIIQLVLNILWSVLFFGWRSPMFAFFEICVLWVAVATTVALSFRHNRSAGWLLVPYLGWASFALILNLMIWRANV